jgi:hypothetical protein
MNDPLFKAVADPAERKQKLIDKAQVVVSELRKIGVERCGDAGPEVHNLAQYLGQVIRELESL